MNGAYDDAVQRWIGYDAAARIESHLHGYDGTLRGSFFEYDALSRLKFDHLKSYNTDLPPDCDDPASGYTDECLVEDNWTLISSDAFDYDALGNRTDRGGSYTVGNRITHFDGCSYATDPDGNVTHRIGTSCATKIDALGWDAENRLSWLKVGSDSLHYYYDALGRLVRTDKNGSAQRLFLWSGETLLAELAGSGTSLTAEYSYYPGLDNLHAVIVSGTIHYAHSDFLGNVVALTDEAKTVTAQFEYGAWGTTDGSPSLERVVRARWKGALWLGHEVDLYYMRNRIYESGTGRFLSEDPTGLAGGLNTYLFAGADPINGADPRGLKCMYRTYYRDGSRVWWSSANKCVDRFWA